MPKQVEPLTAAVIQHAVRKAQGAQQGGRDFPLVDGKGLYLEHRAERFHWRFRYVRPDGRENRLALGQFPEVSLAEARDRVLDLRRQLRDGVDPGAARKAEKAEAKHHAAITDPARIGELLRAIDGFTGQPVTLAALQLAPLVFVRPGELRQAEWSEFDLDGAVWRIPAERMKMKAPHIVPLSTQAVTILRDLYLLTGNGRYVFPGIRTASRPMSENTVNAALRRLGYGKDEMTGHGFRSMAASRLNEMGWNADAIERQLAHAESNKVREAYTHAAQYLSERKRMMAAWADYLDKLRTGANVIPLSRQLA